MMDSTESLPAPPSVPFRRGETIAGKYRIEREIGRGGMGVVLAAVHVQLEQRVAVKVLSSSAAAKPEFVARFGREARAAAKIRSEHVARVIDVGTLETGTAYFVMEHLEGEDLSRLLASRGALPPTLAVDYVLQACQAVAAAHAAGIVHRDIKPANLFVARNADGTSTLKVLDFGVAKLTATAEGGDDGSVTQTGHVFGSPMYMSPEQLRASARVDGRADIWALGVVLSELVTNQAPFLRPGFAEIVAAVMRDPPPPLDELVDDVPEGLEEVILRCLAKEPRLRYANVGDLARALLPFGPKGAEGAVERIERLVRSAETTGDVEPTAAPSSLASAPDSGPAARSDSGRRPGSGSRRRPASGSRVEALRAAAAGADSGERGALFGTAMASSSDAAPARRSRIGIFAVAGSVIAATLAVVAMLRSPAPPVGPSPARAPSIASASVPLSEPPTTATPQPVNTPSPDVELTIDGAPAGAKILRGVVLVGTLPGPIRLPRGDEKVKLRISAAGYAPADVDVVPDGDHLLTVSLLHATPRPATPASPKRSKDLETF